MKTKNLLIAFAITALVQLFVPMKMIFDYNITEKEGTVYNFKAEPVDPYDPFRGKYVTLAYTMESLTVKDTAWESGKTVYISLKKDKDGFAVADNVSADKLEKETDYVSAEVFYYNKHDKNLRVTLPFNRYYMEESKAPEAEAAYREYTTSLKDFKPAYAVVAVKDGNAVLTDVIIDGMPIKEYVEKNRKK